MQGRQHIIDGEHDKAKRAIIPSLVLMIIGILSAIATAFVIVTIGVHVLALREHPETANQQ